MRARRRSRRPGRTTAPPTSATTTTTSATPTRGCTLALDPDALYDLYVTKDGLAKEVRLPELATYVRQNPKTLFWIEIAKGKATYVYGVKL